VTPDADPDDPGVRFVSSSDLISLLANQVRGESTRSLQMQMARAMKKLSVAKGRKQGDRGYFGLERR
jgi:hypothetical protein